MLISKFIWALLIIGVFSLSLFSQDIFIAGEIRSKKTEKVIPDVNIYLPEHTIGTISKTYGPKTKYSQIHMDLPI